MMPGNRQLLAALAPAIRELRKNRGRPSVEHSVFYTRSTDGVELFCTLLGSDPRRCVIVAHPAIVGSYYGQVVALAEELASSFSVILFDFRGHGKSTGSYTPGFGKAADDLEAVSDRSRRMGFGTVGVAGFSLGAAASFLVSARRDCFDALVSIGCPPRFPAMDVLDGHPLASRLALRALGVRLGIGKDPGPSPADVAAVLPGIPKLLVFGEWEVAPADEIEAFAETVTRPRRILTVPGAWHADLAGRESQVREWLEGALP